MAEEQSAVEALGPPPGMGTPYEESAEYYRKVAEAEVKDAEKAEAKAKAGKKSAADE